MYVESNVDHKTMYNMLILVQKGELKIFNEPILWLLQSSYIEEKEEHNYIITEDGLQYLKWLTTSLKLDQVAE